MNENKLKNVTKEELEKLILDEKLSYEEIGRDYGVSGSGIKKKAKKLGIKLPNRRKINPIETFNKNRKSIKRKSKSKLAERKSTFGNCSAGKGDKAVCINCGKEFVHKKTSLGKYCSVKCQLDYQSSIKYKNYLKNPEKYEGQENMKWVKKHILEEQNHKCDICGMEDTWNSKPITFILDHIDGHANNNERSNLRLICPNCDSQLDTYKSKNKNSDRKRRRVKGSS